MFVESRDKKGNWALVLVSTQDRQNTVWAKAKELQDDSMLQQLQGSGDSCVDMIANDFRYHKACLDAYMMQTPSKTCAKPPNVFEVGFAWLVSHIDDTLRTRTVFYFSQNSGINIDNGCQIMMLKTPLHTDHLISNNISKSTMILRKVAK